MTQSQSNPLTNPPFATGATYEEPNWEERYRQLFERHELFLMKLSEILCLHYEVTGENEILEELGNVRKLLGPLVKDDLPAPNGAKKEKRNDNPKTERV